MCDVSAIFQERDGEIWRGRKIEESLVIVVVVVSECV
jgi:hypothetical protein